MDASSSKFVDDYSFEQINKMLREGNTKTTVDYQGEVDVTVEIIKNTNVKKDGLQAFEINGKSKNSMVYKVSAPDEVVDAFIEEIINATYEYDKEALISLATASDYDLDADFDQLVSDMQSYFDDIEFYVALDNKGKIIYFEFADYIGYTYTEITVSFLGGKNVCDKVTGVIDIDNSDDVYVSFDMENTGDKDKYQRTVDMVVGNTYGLDNVQLVLALNKSTGDFEIKGSVDDGSLVSCKGALTEENGEETSEDADITFTVEEYNLSVEKPVGTETDLLSMSANDLYTIIYKVMYGTSEIDGYDFDD